MQEKSSPFDLPPAATPPPSTNSTHSILIRGTSYPSQQQQHVVQHQQTRSPLWHPIPTPQQQRQQLSAEQRQRIDQNFRAAKAILGRKRPLSYRPGSAPPSTPEPVKSFGFDLTNMEMPLQSTPDYRSPVSQKKACFSPIDAKQDTAGAQFHGSIIISNDHHKLFAQPHMYDNHKTPNRIEAIKKTTIFHNPSPLGKAGNFPSLEKENKEPLVGKKQETETKKQISPHDEFFMGFGGEIWNELDGLCEGKIPLAELRDILVNGSAHKSQETIQKDSNLNSAGLYKKGQEVSASTRSGSGIIHSHIDKLLAKDGGKEAPTVLNKGNPAQLSGSLIQVEKSAEMYAGHDLEPDSSAFDDISGKQNCLSEVIDESNSSESQSLSRRPSDILIVDVPKDTVDSSCSSHLSSSVDCSAIGCSPHPTPTSDAAVPNVTLLESTPSGLIDLSVPAAEALPAYLQSLNESQREAALSDTSKPLLVLAGPGSGKTSTMVARLLTLLKQGVHAKNILAMTFTTAAASEMKERVGIVAGKKISKELTVCTFHSFCLQLCRSNAEKLGRTSEFLVYGRGQQRRAVVEATRLSLADLQMTKNADVPCNASSDVSILENKWDHSVEDTNPAFWKDKAKKWQQLVTQAKAAGRTPEHYEKDGNTVAAAILRHYNGTLAACDALDYHDLISSAVKLLQDDPEVLLECQTMWTCVLVDEFQDTSKMQYQFLQLLASHNRITAVGDDDQSIFSFNGADSTGFESFRKDFPCLKEVRLHHNYRSTRCIVEAASSLIQNNLKRCHTKQACTDNDCGDKIVVKECRNEEAQCAYVIDTILMNAMTNDAHKPVYLNTAILYRRQVTGKIFQSALRARKIPFNVHGVAFYRKKVVKDVIAMLQTALHGGWHTSCNRVFKSLYAGDKAESKRVVEYIEKVSDSFKCNFLEAARNIFSAKVSGRFNRRQLAQGRKVLAFIDNVYCLVHKEQSLSAVVMAVVNLLPQRSIFEKRAVVDEEGGKLLNENEDHRTVLDYLLDDVTDFLCNHFNIVKDCGPYKPEDNHAQGCSKVLKAFLDHMTLREADNYKFRREENKNSVTLTTMHQSKGLEWDTVFIVKANDSETPLLHENMGMVGEEALSLEEERRLFYVAMTRARKKLIILYVVLDSNWQLLRPSRFLGEMPHHLLEFQVYDVSSTYVTTPVLCCIRGSEGMVSNTSSNDKRESGCSLEAEKHDSKLNTSMIGHNDFSIANGFLKGFNVESRSIIAALFHGWAKKSAFQDPRRLLEKVCLVIDERLRNKSAKNKEVLRSLRCCLKDEAALSYAEHVVNWGKMPPEERALLQAERQEHFQQQSAERSMGTAPATSKQTSYLRSLGCTIEPTSRLHASRLIEKYKAL